MSVVMRLCHWNPSSSLIPRLDGSCWILTDPKLACGVQQTRTSRYVHRNVNLLFSDLPQHAERVLKILDLQDLFDGIVSCDYADPSL
jgi:hypothetical protein